MLGSEIKAQEIKKIKEESKRLKITKKKTKQE